jgi:hypothetical protein
MLFTRILKALFYVYEILKLVYYFIKEYKNRNAQTRKKDKNV